MIGIKEFQDIIANEFLDGSTELAGISMFIMAMIVVFALAGKNPFMALIVGMGITMFFSIMGVLSSELTMLMIIVSVLGLAYTSRSVWRD